MPRTPVATRARDQLNKCARAHYLSPAHNACSFPFPRVLLPFSSLTSTFPPLLYHKPSNKTVPHLHDFDMFGQLPRWLIMFTPEMRGSNF